MDPYSEERLTQEVLHLHALWHRGPPPRNPIPTHNHSSTPLANPIPSNKRPIGPDKPKNKNKNKKKPRPDPPQPQDSAPNWPCPQPLQNQPSTSSWWPPIQPVPTPAAQPVSSEDRQNLAALQLQDEGSDACREFFARNADSESDEEEEEEDEDDWEMMESKEYKFFLKMFVENEELRVYYEKNCESGLFCCLVCGGMGKKKSGKRFENCLGLVQHSLSISRTKKKRAHRAFGLVVSRVFGWDVDRLPTIVLKGEPLSRSLANSGDLKVQLEEIHVDNEYEVVSVNVNEDEQKLEEVKTAEDPTSNSKDWVSGENDDAWEDNDVMLQVGNADNSISGMGESDEEMDNFPVTVLRACKEFNAAFFGSMNDDDVSEKELMDGAEESEEFKFFLKLFTENENLRRYYENHYGDGEFTCLACQVAGRKSKCFKTCRRLLQHSTHLGKNNTQNQGQKPQKTKMLKTGMLAHRAYTLVVCKVLGCDIEMLPAVVLKGEALGCSLTKSEVSKDKSVGKMQSSIMDDNVEDDSTKVNELEGIK
ncbi:uncharacterized protein LOC101207110 isoform X2 [Cucumis sativus]|uniref:uncharacterized protein LOC101207110 isoform X2 n=1 Tax=Cucumis sativus TaxID=3659 RepID=UPI0002B46ED3|nr:uncharacterized protein LOC101207110 isoform X2 [Cucumis sativus]